MTPAMTAAQRYETRTRYNVLLGELAELARVNDPTVAAAARTVSEYVARAREGLLGPLAEAYR